MIKNWKEFENKIMKVEVYSCEDGSISVVTEDDPNKKILIGDNAKLLRKIEGKDWNDCMRQHYDIMGWEPYKPFDND